MATSDTHTRLGADGIDTPATQVKWVNIAQPAFNERFRDLADSLNATARAFAALRLSFEGSLSPAGLRHLVRLLTKPPCRRGWDCLCHPEPFPAGRDYRRRTKHRNRRRKR